MDMDAEIPEEGDNTKTSHRKEMWQPGQGSDEDSAESMTHRATFHERGGIRDKEAEDQSRSEEDEDHGIMIVVVIVIVEINVNSLIYAVRDSPIGSGDARKKAPQRESNSPLKLT